MTDFAFINALTVSNIDEMVATLTRKPSNISSSRAKAVGQLTAILRRDDAVELTMENLPSLCRSRGFGDTAAAIEQATGQSQVDLELDAEAMYVAHRALTQETDSAEPARDLNEDMGVLVDYAPEVMSSGPNVTVVSDEITWAIPAEGTDEIVLAKTDHQSDPAAPNTDEQELAAMKAKDDKALVGVLRANRKGRTKPAKVVKATPAVEDAAPKVKVEKATPTPRVRRAKVVEQVAEVADEPVVEQVAEVAAEVVPEVEAPATVDRAPLLAAMQAAYATKIEATIALKQATAAYKDARRIYEQSGKAPRAPRTVGAPRANKGEFTVGSKVAKFYEMVSQPGGATTDQLRKACNSKYLRQMADLVAQVKGQRAVCVRSEAKGGQNTWRLQAA